MWYLFGKSKFLAGLQTKQLEHFIPAFINDSDDLIEQLGDLGHLSVNARLFKADPNSMYTNIDTEHGLALLGYAGE